MNTGEKTSRPDAANGDEVGAAGRTARRRARKKAARLVTRMLEPQVMTQAQRLRLMPTAASVAQTRQQNHITHRLAVGTRLPPPIPWEAR